MTKHLLSIALLAIGGIHGARAENSPTVTADNVIAVRQTGMEIQSSVIAAILQAIGTNADTVPLAKAAAAGNQSEFIKVFRVTSLACATCHVTYCSGRN